MLRTLVYVPLYPSQPRIRPETVESLGGLRWHGPLDLLFGREDAPERGGYENILAKYQRARETFLGGGYEAMLTVEADMIVPALALERLTRLECDVAYGLYISRHGTRRWLAMMSIEGARGLSLSEQPEKARKLWGSAVVTKGAGLGCTLIHRRVMEQIPFRREEGGAACDWAFAKDCEAAGLRQMHDLGVACGHITDNGTALWPDIDSPELFREERG